MTDNDDNNNSSAVEPLPQELQTVRDECLAFVAKEAHGTENWKTLREPHRPIDLGVWQFIGSKDNWNDNDHDDDVTNAVCGGRDIICVRGSLRFPDTKPHDVLRMIRNLNERPRWDKAMKRGAVRRTYRVVPDDDANNNNDGCDVAHLEYAGVPLLVSGRDLCLFRYWREEKTTSGLARATLVAKSVINDAVPVTNNVVRADLMECGYLMEEVADEEDVDRRHTDVVYISSLDFKGSLPTQLVNMSLKLQPSTLQNMRKLLKAKKKKGVS